MRPALWSLLLASALPAFGQSAPAPYRVDWLGPDFFPHALNDRGQVVGYDARSRGHGPALLWEDGSTTDLGVGEAHDINNAGQIVLGVPVGSGTPGAVLLGLDGRRTDIGLPEGWGSDFRHQFSINDRGQIVGMQKNATSSDGRAFLWDAGTVTYLDPGPGPGPTYGSAHAINNAGQVVGWWWNAQTGGGYLWHDGSVTPLPWPAVSLNDRGQVLMGSNVWSAGETTPVDPLPLLPISDPEQGVFPNAREINNLGQVVGWQRENYFVSVEDGYGATERAFVWDAAGGAVDLNAVMGMGRDAANQYPLAQALDVNDLGQIVGFGTRGGWLLTPVPEPAGAVLMLFGCTALTRRRRPTARDMR